MRTGPNLAETCTDVGCGGFTLADLSTSTLDCSLHLWYPDCASLRTVSFFHEIATLTAGFHPPRWGIWR